MEVRVLGPIEVWHGSAIMPFARRQQRLIIGILALEANSLVPCSRLVDLLWDDRPPQNARAVVQSRISEVRRALNAVRPAEDVAQLVSHGDGYLLRISDSQVDAHRFRRAVERKEVPASDDEHRQYLRDALQLWHGPVLGGWLAGGAYDALCQGLTEARLTMVEDLFDIELRLDRHAQVVDEIVDYAEANPTRERLTGQRMIALHRTGRSADALLVYDRWRRWLSKELGVDPGVSLQDLHVRILKGQSSPDGATQRTEVLADADLPDEIQGRFRSTVPRLLPPAAGDFVGREGEISFVRQILTREAEPADEVVPVVAICGPGGVGKTTLSVRVAHNLSEQYPDGQLYVNLRGMDPNEPVETFEALGRFLRALGVAGLALPDSLDERAELYRDLLANRRVLILIDNAANDDQTWALIPGSPSCGVIINSRSRLGATLGATVLNLDVLDLEQSLTLLSRVVGDHRISAEPEASTALVQRCGQLPLALRIVSAKLSGVCRAPSRPGRPARPGRTRPKHPSPMSAASVPSAGPWPAA